MKRRSIYILALILALLLTACGSSEPKNTEENVAAVPETTKAPTPEAKNVDYEITYTNARTWTNSIGSTWVQTIVEIANTGTENLYLSSGSYDLENPDGSLVAAKSMVSAFPNVIAPGEKGYMYEETTLDNYNGDGNLNVLPRPDVKEAKVDLIRYSVTDLTVSDGQFGIKVMGRVENTSDEEGALVYVVAFFYDENDTLMGSAFTILSEKLAPGAKVGFEFSSFSLPDDVSVKNIKNTIVCAYPNQLQF